MMQVRVREVVVAVVLLALCVAMRLVDHAPNFTPIAAASLFAGFFFRSRVLALGLPLAAMFISDLVGPGIYDLRLMVIVYLCLALPALLGPFVRGRWMPLRIVGASLAGSLLFFVVTNGAVFAWSSMYARSFAGCIECYTLALPFFRNTVLGDLAWNCTFFGAWALAPIAWRSVRARTRKATA